jgi:PhzF family phenazine biosynthesis protein
MPKELSLYQVDAFADAVFAGNPAAVVPLDEWLPDALLQAIAMENNLSETAFFVPEGEGFHLRWFTPTFEIDLCGHATLAAAWVLFTELGYAGARLRFQSQSGPLFVERAGNLLTLDFPSWPPAPVAVTPLMERAFGARPLEAHAGRDLLCVFEDEDAVRGMKPDFAAFHEMPYVCSIASAACRPGADADIVCRVFCPEAGIPEDPVTGSAHSLLTPFWAARLGKTSLRSHQVSARGGRLSCGLAGDRVCISGAAVTYLRGRIRV